MAERVGFEPTIRLPVCRISSAVLSTTQPPLRFAGRRKLCAGCLLAGKCRACKGENPTISSFHLDSFWPVTYASRELDMGQLCPDFSAPAEIPPAGAAIVLDFRACFPID